MPEFPQARDAPLGRVARDQGRVDGADGNARDPMRQIRRCSELFIHAGLIGAQGAAALQHQRVAVVIECARANALRDHANLSWKSSQGASL